MLALVGVFVSAKITTILAYCWRRARFFSKSKQINKILW